MKADSIVTRNLFSFFLSIPDEHLTFYIDEYNENKLSLEGRLALEAIEAMYDEDQTKRKEKRSWVKNLVRVVVQKVEMVGQPAQPHLDRLLLLVKKVLGIK